MATRRGRKARSGMDEQEQTLREITEKADTVFQGPVFRVEVSEVRLPNGAKARRDVVRHPGAVCVLPITKDGDVLLVRQWRAGYRGVTLEIPAGKLDPGETDMCEAAERELREETGAVAGRMISLGDYYGSPAILEERIAMYLAEDLTFGETDFDEDEFLAPVRMTLDDLVHEVLEGHIPDGKTQVAALRAYCMRHDFSRDITDNKR